MEFKMRKVSRALGEDEARELLSGQSHAVLSVVDADGEPYGVPISYAVVGRRAYFHGARDVGHKLANIGDGRSCPACLTAVAQDDVQPAGFTTRYASAMGFGRLRLATDDDEKRAGLMALLSKYSSGHMEAGVRYMEAALDKTSVMVLELERVTGKSSAR